MDIYSLLTLWWLENYKSFNVLELRIGRDPCVFCTSCKDPILQFKLSTLGDTTLVVYVDCGGYVDVRPFNLADPSFSFDNLHFKDPIDKHLYHHCLGPLYAKSK